MTDLVHIKTNGLLWRPEAKGYTSVPALAGKWPRTEAEDIIKDLGPEKYACLIDVKEEETFAHMPVSLTEVKSERSLDARDWTPRDVLVQLLREIDSGEREVSALFVGWREDSEHDGRRSCDHKFSRAGGQSIFEDVGLVEGIKFQMLAG